MFSYDEYQSIQERAGLLDRNERGRLQLTGVDRRAYLHGLLTNDIQALDAGQGCYAALLTPQGRMISDMRVSELGDRILIDLPIRTMETVRNRLADFIFSEDVEVRDVHAALGQVGLYGHAASAILSAVLTTRAGTDAGPNDSVDGRRQRLDSMALYANSVWERDAAPVIVVASDDYGIQGFDVFCSREKQEPLRRALSAAGATEVSLETASVCRVEAGRPEFGIDMDEHTIPLEAGIEGRAISLTKGCYVGQEVIVRVLHRGHGRVAKRLAGFVASPGDSLAPGARLLANDDPSKEVGEVTSAAVSPRLRRPIGLGYVRRDYSTAGTVLRVDAVDPSVQVTIVTLPFIPQATG